MVIVTDPDHGYPDLPRKDAASRRRFGGAVRSRVTNHYSLQGNTHRYESPYRHPLE